ncbi:MAG: hypothetical protein A49_28170 [Methyloceanibacter sp.]|nr:MAG: hypothetical protein A49_28170 [Methyloceanibacter sp.]
MTEFWLSDEEMDEQIEANRLACQRLDDFDRDDDDWDEIWDGVFAILAEHLGEVREALTWTRENPRSLRSTPIFFGPPAIRSSRSSIRPCSANSACRSSTAARR